MTPAEQEREWLHEIRIWWQLYNLEFVGGGLREPGFRLLDTVDGAQTRVFGTWNPGRREIGISRQHIQKDPWLEVARTLRHEMAHQVADEIYGATGEAPHGPAFQRACRRLRVERLHPDLDPNPERARLVARVQKLMALSSSANEHEASLALRKARLLLLEHQLEPDRIAGRDYTSLWLGPIRKRHHAWEYSLGAVLQEHFGVSVLWTTAYLAQDCVRGTVLEAYGTREHLQLAEHVHTVLWRLLPRLWERHKLATGLRSNRDRQRFYAGVVEGFLAKLERQDRQLQQEEGLVAVGDPELNRYVRYHNPRIRTVRSGGGAANPAYSAGKEAGDQVRLDPAVRGGDDGGHREPRLLGDRRRGTAG